MSVLFGILLRYTFVRFTPLYRSYYFYFIYFCQNVNFSGQCSLRYFLAKMEIVSHYFYAFFMPKWKLYLWLSIQFALAKNTISSIFIHLMNEEMAIAIIFLYMSVEEG